MKTTVVPNLTGKSRAKVARVLCKDGLCWIEKHGGEQELDDETRILEWCAGRLPVAKVLENGPGFLKTSELLGKNVSDLSVQQAVEVIARGIQLIHAVPIEDCPFFADWTLRLAEGEVRARAGLIDESDFDEDNRGRSIDDSPKGGRFSRSLPSRGSYARAIDNAAPNWTGLGRCSRRDVDCVTFSCWLASNT